jgi:ABC-type polysaccharide/polyol phosphate transport system ATPase subunit
MALILLSLHSPQSREGALGLLDPETGLRYLQIDAPSILVRNSVPRAVATFKDRIYVTTSASIRIYQLDDRKNKPLLKLEREVILNEWLLGEGTQANLVSIAASEERNRLYVANNNFCAVDELDSEGSFIRRRHLWEIAPDLFPLPDHSTSKSNIYGIMRNFPISPTGDVFITVTDCNNSSTGKVISLETGEELIPGLHDPHDGLFANNLFYLNDIDQGTYPENKHSGKLYAYTFSQPSGTTVIDSVCWAVRPEIARAEFSNSIQNLRGMALSGDTLYCGVTHFGKISPDQIPSRVVAFHAQSGTQLREYFLPDLTILRQPRVMFMTPLAENFTVHWKQDLYFYRHEEQLQPEYHREEKKEKAEDIPAGGDAGVVTAEALGVPPAAPNRPADEGGEASADLVSAEAAGQEIFTSEGGGIAGKPGETPVTQGENGADKGKGGEPVQWFNTAPEQEKAKVPSVILENVSLRYRRTASFSLFSSNKNLGRATDFLALDNVSFTIYEDETVGIIGRNGSGKSTVSMIISGALPPDAGRVRVTGKVQLLALGVGFRPELTGRENVYISGTLLGMTRKHVTEKMPEIEEFAELGEFFDEPLRIYSSGMRSRLGFAVATAVNPDILILDEVMSTGDAAFKNKADQRMQAMRRRTKTVLMVSHNAEQVKNQCSRVIWLEKGRMLMSGQAVPILAEYNKFCKNPDKWLEKHAQNPVQSQA